MKKFTITSLLTLFLVSFGYAEHVSVTSAQRAAQNFLKSFNVESVELVDVTADAKFANLYVFTSEHGFVVMSADNRVRPVLGYSLTNSFVTEDMPENVRAWFQGYNDQIQYAIDYRLSASNDVALQWESLIKGDRELTRATEVVAPLIRTQWSQKTPYNALCPEDASGDGGHALTGCVATGIAQIMNYWEHPVRGIGSHSYTHSTYGEQSANFGSTVYDWDHMLNSYTGDYTTEEALAVAVLMYHCGVSQDMNYGPTASGAAFYTSSLVNYFDYSTDISSLHKENYSDEEWVSIIQNELDNERPVFYIGSGPYGGHVFIMDGYDDNGDLHVNWGWGGRCDGFYTIGALNPESFPNGFNEYNAVIIGVHPNTPSIDAPSVSAVVDGDDVIVTWNSVSDAASYKVYRDDNLIANSVTGTSFIDAQPFYGDHAYYVKSVKSDGTMSLKSNTVVVNVHFAGPVPSDLQASVNDNDVHLTWIAPKSRNDVLQYGTEGFVGALGGEDGFYWAQRYPSDDLGDYMGMAINKVSVRFRIGGDYMLYLYSGNELGPVNMLGQVPYTAQYGGWYDIELTNPVALDCSNDLWVVMYASPGVKWAGCYCGYTDSGVDNACYYSSTGSYWSKYGNGAYSWLMKTYITDGTFTYNIYRDDVNIAANVTEASYDDNGLDYGTYTYYVTTNYFGGESDASSAVTVNVVETVTWTVAFAAGWNWWSTNHDITLDDLCAAFEAALPGAPIQINSKNSFTTYNGVRWRGTLDALDVTQMYKIHVPVACEITLSGAPFNPEDHPVTIHNGVNWIGYPLAEAMSLADIFAGFSANGDMVKSKGLSSSFNGVRWRGNLSLLEPGKGYVYKSSVLGDRTFVFSVGNK